MVGVGGRGDRNFSWDELCDFVKYIEQRSKLSVLDSTLHYMIHLCGGGVAEPLSECYMYAVVTIVAIPSLCCPKGPGFLSTFPDNNSSCCIINTNDVIASSASANRSAFRD